METQAIQKCLERVSEEMSYTLIHADPELTRRRERNKCQVEEKTVDARGSGRVGCLGQGL